MAPPPQTTGVLRCAGRWGRLGRKTTSVGLGGGGWVFVSSVLNPLTQKGMGCLYEYCPRWVLEHRLRSRWVRRQPQRVLGRSSVPRGALSSPLLLGMDIVVCKMRRWDGSCARWGESVFAFPLWGRICVAGGGRDGGRQEAGVRQDRGSDLGGPASAPLSWIRYPPGPDTLRSGPVTNNACRAR